MQAEVVAPRLVAVLGPALVLGLAVATWGATPPPAPTSPAAAELEKRLGDQPDVVVLGNSKVRTDLDLPALKKALGSTGEVVDLRVEGSFAPTWYAVLENRVVARGVKPRLVVVYGPLEQLLETRPNGDVDRARIEAQLDGDDVALDRVVFGRAGGSGLLDRMRSARTAAHAAFMDGLRDRAVGSLLGEGHTDAATEGAALAKPALSKVFAEDAFLEGPARARVLPVAEATAPAGDTGPTVRVAPRDTLLPEFIARAKDTGARILFVRAPVPASNRRADDVDAATLKAAVEVMNEGGAGWLDLTAKLRLSEDAFKDELHMNAVGRAAFAPALAEALAAMRPLDPAATMPAATAPLAPTKVAREGAPPTLTQPTFTRTDTPCGYIAAMTELAGVDDESLVPLGLGTTSPLVVTMDGAPLAAHAGREDFAMRCGGAFLHRARELRVAPTDTPETGHTFAIALSPDFPLVTASDSAWWLYPGTTARWSFEGAPPADGASVRVTAELRVRSGAMPSLSIGGQRVTAEDIALDAAATDATLGAGRASLHIARAVLDAPVASLGGAWDIALATDGYAIVERLAVGSGADTVWLVGEPTPEVRMTAGRATWAAPQDVPVMELTKVVSQNDGRTLEVPGWGFLDDEVTREATGVADCSPIRVLANGKPLTAPHTPEDAVRRLGGGRYAHRGDMVVLPAPNPLAPADATFTAVFDTARRCEAGLWLHPGDVLSGLGVPDDLRRLRRGARALVLDVKRFAPATPSRAHDAPLHVELLLKGAPLLSADVDAETVGKGVVTLQLPSPTPPRTTALELRFTAPDARAHWLVSRAALLETVPEEAGP